MSLMISTGQCAACWRWTSSGTSSAQRRCENVVSVEGAQQRTIAHFAPAVPLSFLCEHFLTRLFGDTRPSAQ